MQDTAPNSPIHIEAPSSGEAHTIPQVHASKSQAAGVLTFPNDPEREDAYKRLLDWTKPHKVNIIHSPIDPKTIYRMPNDERWIFLDKIMRELVLMGGGIFNVGPEHNHSVHGKGNYISITDRGNTLLKRWFVTLKGMHPEANLVGLERAETGRRRGGAGYRGTPEETGNY